MKILGVDEAGRGPVLGPLIMGAILAEESGMEGFRDIGVKDSKALTRKARERIYDRLSKTFQIDHEIVSPAEISRAESNLNQLEYHALSRLIMKHQPDRLIVDAFMAPARLAKEIVRDFPRLTVIAEYKADENFPIVSAASIVAKVIRDRHIEDLKAVHGDVGSGYPGDPRTKRWLRAQFLKNALTHKSALSFIRTNWMTVRRLTGAKDPSCQPSDPEV